MAPGSLARVALLRRSLDLTTGKPETVTDAAAPGAALPSFEVPAAPASN